MQTPAVQSHRLAMTFWRRFSNLLKGKLSTTALEKAKTQSVKEAARERQDRRSFDAKLKTAVTQETQRRAAALSKAFAKVRGIEDIPSKPVSSGNRKAAAV